MSKEKAMQQLMEQIESPGDGVFAISTVPKKNSATLDQLVQASAGTHTKMIQILKAIAESSGLDLTVKTVLLIKPKRGNKK